MFHSLCIFNVTLNRLFYQQELDLFLRVTSKRPLCSSMTMSLTWIFFNKCIKIPDRSNLKKVWLILSHSLSWWGSHGDRSMRQMITLPPLSGHRRGGVRVFSSLPPLYLIIYLSVCACVLVCIWQHRCGNQEDDLQALALSFYHASHRDRTYVIRLGIKHLYSLGYLAGPRCCFI